MNSNIIDKLRLWLGFAMAGGEKLLIPANKDGDGYTITTEKQQGSSLMNALLKREVNQEVLNLVYRTYLVETLASQKTVIGIGEDDMEAFAVPLEVTKPAIEESETDYEAVFVQDILPIASGVADCETDENDMIISPKEEEYYWLRIERDGIIPKWKFEKYCEKFVVKRKKENHDEYIVELYFTLYTDPINNVKTMFTLNMEKVFDKKMRIHFIDEPSTITIYSMNAWGSNNNIEYRYRINDFKGITKYNGSYVVKYWATLEEKTNVVEKWRQDEVDKLYQENAPRNGKGITYETEERTDKCSVCDKEVRNTEIADLRITQREFGKKMCRTCFADYLLKEKIIK
jgi:hypothetical protein